ncbi:MAG: S8 family peptidase [Lewinellaceae bacterium]|nr:S8 family peptidase [Lewinellaceae bacterium]
MPRIFTALFCFSLLSGLQAQERRSGELLLQLSGDAVINTVISQLRQQLPAADFSYMDAPAEDWRMYRLHFDETSVTAQQALETARRIQSIRAVQLNFRSLERYTEPNDPEWWRQSDMAMINAPAAWDVSTGGFTLQGDTIVVAVLEKGAEMAHPDLKDQHQFNWAEIPNNFIDDDNNGYVDDYAGWDARNGGDGNGNGGTHGTMVNGIIGASGNNAKGVSGVNWNIRLLNISNTEYENEIIAGYRYVAAMRKLYNQTNGAKGQFVVVSNASFGIDFAKAQDHPLWCAVYDSLGKVGVLSVGATANSGNSDIDVVGDMPTSCPSEYLITVTNVDNFDNKVSGAGYGTQSIDLGAPGQNVYSTGVDVNGLPNYGTNSGTSFSAPHVSGSVALLYSLNCPNFVNDALTDPAAAARRVRNVLFENVAPNASLNGKASTDGRLDLGAAVQAVQDFCGGVRGPMEILWLGPNPARNQVAVYYQTPTYDDYELRVFNMLGQLMYETTISPDPFATPRYEFNINSYPPGMYSVVISRYKLVRTKKFLKI